MRRVVFVIYERFQPLDLVGPHEVFGHASALTGGGYRCQIAAPGLVRAPSGLPVHAEHAVADLAPDGIDSLVVVGGIGVDQARHDTTLVDWIAAAAEGARRVTSVCNGVFLQAAAGIVRGRRVTTHWTREEQLRHEHPEVTVDCDPIFIRDGASGPPRASPRAWTSPSPWWRTITLTTSRTRLLTSRPLRPLRFNDRWIPPTLQLQCRTGGGRVAQLLGGVTQVPRHVGHPRINQAVEEGKDHGE